MPDRRPQPPRSRKAAARRGMRNGHRSGPQVERLLATLTVAALHLQAALDADEPSREGEPVLSRPAEPRLREPRLR